MSDTLPTNDNFDWQDIAQTFTVRRLLALSAWLDYANLGEEKDAVNRVIELMTGTEASGDGVGGSRTIAGKLPVLAPHE